MAVRKRWIAAGVVLAAFVGLAYPGLREKFRDLGPSYFYRVTFRATFDGAPVELDQFLECRPFRVCDNFGMNCGTALKKTPEETGIVLAEGGALYFPTPHYCWYVRGRPHLPNLWQPGKSIDIIPYVHWANKAENPDVIEAYALPEYYEAKGARLRIIESHVTFMPKGFEPQQKVAIDPRLAKLKGRGWALVPLPADLRESSLGEVVAESASGRIAALRIPEPMKESIGRNLAPVSDYESGVGYGIPINLPSMLIAVGRREKFYEGRRLSAGVLPITWDGSVYRVVEDQPPGLYYFYPGNPVYVTMDREDPTVIFRKERIVLPTRGSKWPSFALCDRQSGGCYRLRLRW